MTLELALTGMSPSREVTIQVYLPACVRPMLDISRFFTTDRRVPLGASQETSDIIIVVNSEMSQSNRRLSVIFTLIVGGTCGGLKTGERERERCRLYVLLSV